MFSFLKKKTTHTPEKILNSPPGALASNAETTLNQETAQNQPPSLLQRLKSGLSKTRSQFTSNLAHFILGKKSVDAETLQEIETRLLQADLGTEVTRDVIQNMTAKLARHELKDGDAVLQALKQELIQLLQQTLPAETASTTTPHVILMVGVNGTGKTTSIGKLAYHYKNEGKKVLLAAGDTFRAAAIEQLQVWAERNQVPIIAQHIGADSASVLFDALSAAQARNMDILIADTAGRLHTKSNLMEELKKIKRVLSKLDATAPHELLLVLDATIGQNAIVQAQEFHAAIGLTGLIVTKLDGTAKGGAVFAIAQQLRLPIKFIGTGEQLGDLAPFNPEAFVCALFDE